MKILFSRFVKSLSVRLLLLTLIWVSFISTTVAYTMLLNWELEASSAATKMIEEMRYRSFRAALFAQKQYPEQEFREEVDLFTNHIALLEKGDKWKPLMMPDTPEVQEAFKGVVYCWAENLRPKFFEARQSGQPVSMQDVTIFVEQLSMLAKHIEATRAGYLWQLRYLQALLILLGIGSLFAIEYLLFRWVIRPLKNLGAGIDKLWVGDLNVRVQPACDDEIGQITEGFNKMAERLRDSYENLEQKVADKTASVEEKNNHLTQLYEMTSYLAHRQDIDDIFEGFQNRVLGLTLADACLVQLKDEKDDVLGVAASHGIAGDVLKAVNDWHDAVIPAEQILDKSYPIFLRLSEMQGEYSSVFVSAGFQQCYCFQIRSSNVKGICTLFYKTRYPLPAPRMRLMESFSTHFAVAIENTRLSARDEQFAIVQERQLFSQGLHDSIAQTLSFLNLQTQFLSDAIRNDDLLLRDESLENIREGVQECYVDVRELLVNYREKLHKTNFIDGVRTVIQRFETQSHVEATLRVSGEGVEPDPRQKLQIIFIIQEALSNVRKHAQADNVDVRIENEKDLTVTILDDGVGIDSDIVEIKKGRHVGLSIMAERAARIGATVTVTRASPIGGTRVTLSLKEEARRLS